MGTPTGGRVALAVEEEEVFPVNQRVAAAQGTEQVVLVVCWRARGQEVVFTLCLSFFHVVDRWRGPVAF